MTPHCQPLRKRYCTRCAKECVQFLIAAFDLICFLRPLPLCGGVSEVRLLGKRIARVKCTQSCTAADNKSPPCGLPINRSAERCRPAAAALRRGEGHVAVCRATKGPCVPLI